MLSKKILHLKKKIESHYNNIFKIQSLIEDNKSLTLKVASLISKLHTQEKELKILQKDQEDLIDLNKEDILTLKDRINELEKYKDICTNDIPVMASAITELYNILNVLVTGKPMLSKKIEEEIFPTADELSYTEFFENEEILPNGKKKKKVYH